MNDTLEDTIKTAGEDETPRGESRVYKRFKMNPLSLTVFERENDGQTFHTVQVQRAYTTDDGDSFDYTNSLRPQDLRKAARLLELAADDLQDARVEEGDA